MILSHCTSSTVITLTFSILFSTMDLMSFGLFYFSETCFCVVESAYEWHSRKTWNKIMGKSLFSQWVTKGNRGPLSRMVSSDPLTYLKEDSFKIYSEFLSWKKLSETSKACHFYPNREECSLTRHGHRYRVLCSWSWTCANSQMASTMGVTVNCNWSLMAP